MKRISQKKLVLLILGAMFLVLAAVAGMNLFWPSWIEISPETTYLTEPLDDQGGIDYLAAINARYSEGVTPENNAAVDYVQAFPPDGMLTGELREEVFREFGLPTKETTRHYLHGFYMFEAPQLFNETLSAQGVPADETDGRDWYELDSYKMHWDDYIKNRPWTGQELPIAEAWLQQQAEPLAHIEAGAAKPTCYFPIIATSEDEFTTASLLGSSLQYADFREANRALMARAMRRVQDDPRRAWRDTITMHHVARHAGDQPFAIASLIRIALSNMADRTAANVVHFGHFSPEELIQMQAELAALPASRSLSEQVGIGERLYALAWIQDEARGEELDIEIIEIPGRPIGVNWNTILRINNLEYTRYHKILEMPWGEAKTRAFLAWEEHLSEQASPEGLDWLVSIISREARSRRSAYATLEAFMLPINIIHADHRTHVSREMAKAAITLTRYRAMHGEYPERLEQLVPECAEAVPVDLFSDGQPLKYQRIDEGYLLYSVGPDGQDNGGEGTLADDVALQIPVPIEPLDLGEEFELEMETE